MITETDIIIAGGGFAGLACAKALAEAGIAVTVLERKKAAGADICATSIIVKECADEFAIPDYITRKVTDVRLYAPSLRFSHLKSPDFLTADTPELMRYLSEAAIRAGATILYDTPYLSASQSGDRIIVNPIASAYQPAATFSCRFLIGADGPCSKVADDFKLGKNTEFLLGAEAEYKGLSLPDNKAFYCFLNRKLAFSYIGWIIPGVGATQFGLAQRLPRKPDVNAFAARMSGTFDFSHAKITARREGLIPIGGPVNPFARDNVILVGDAAGITSPLAGRDIHTALHYGKIVGKILADHLLDSGKHPTLLLPGIYPRFYAQQLLRKTYEMLAQDWLIDIMVTNPLFTALANIVFFRKKLLK